MRYRDVRSRNTLKSCIFEETRSLARFLRYNVVDMGRQLHITALTALLLLAMISTAEARNGRENQVPHGNNFGCEVCHTAAGGLNDFGFDSFDYTSGGNVDWGGLADLDSDRDGYSNGEELGDPDGTWSSGDPAPGGDFSNPGERDDGLCGNGSMEGEEECEPGNLGGATCDSMGLGAGNLSCSDTCRYDTSGCDTCGDGTIQGGEECDGSDLAGETCESLGLGTGTLSCTGCGYNTVGCSDGDDEMTPDTCGDGARQGTEACDGSDLAGETCATLGYTGGTLGCQVRCDFDTSGCIGTQNTSTQGGSGGGLSGDGSGETSDPDTQGNNGASFGGADSPIELEGHACTTSPHRGRSTGGALLVILLGWFFVGRRRRSA